MDYAERKGKSEKAEAASAHKDASVPKTDALSVTEMPLWAQASLGDAVPSHLLPVFQRKEGSFPASNVAPAVNHTGLPDSVKTGIENLSGLSLDDVRVHYNSDKPAQIEALAYTQGTEIHVGPGQEKHIAHEAWHVVQQMQGRVLPSVHRKDGVSLNDDRRLEHEADVMGGKAATGVTHVDVPDTRALVPSALARLAFPHAADTVQAIMSVAEFQAATPAGFLKPRETVTAIDHALNVYIQIRTAANATTLVGVILNYINGNHDAARIGVATQLLQRARAERRLLQQIGDAHAFLVDGLIEQAGIARIDQLVQLSADATPANATVLPNLINTVGDANITNLNTSGLVTAVGAAHVPLLAPMITYIGGVAERVRLFTIVNRHAGAGDLAFDLTREAAGNAATFARLAGEVPEFQQVAAPGAVPVGVTNAVTAYNNARHPALIAELNNLIAAANIAHAQATALPAAGPGAANPAAVVNAALLANVLNRIAAVQARVVALGVPGAAGGPADVAAAQQARQIISVALNNAVAAAVAARAVAAPAAFTAAVANVDNVNTRAANAANAPAINTVNFAHFLVRHTAHYFDFGDIKLDNTQWPTAWGNNAANQVETNFIGVLNGLSAAGNWLQPGNPIPNQACPLGGTAQIAGLAAPGVANQINVGQFFPENTPAANIYDHPDTTMRAIRKVL